MPVTAKDVSYNNTASGLSATDVQAAIDELEANAAQYLFLNGLSEANKIVSLGGELTKDTMIDLLTYVFAIQSPGGGPNQVAFRVTGGSSAEVKAQVNDQIATVLHDVSLAGGAKVLSSVISGALISKLNITPQVLQWRSDLDITRCQTVYG